MRDDEEDVLGGGFERRGAGQAENLLRNLRSCCDPAQPAAAPPSSTQRTHLLSCFGDEWKCS